MKGVAADLTGQRFDKLTVIKRHGSDPRGSITWLCRCDCGNESIIVSYSLTRKQSRSCGCHTRELLSQSHTTHGQSGSVAFGIGTSKEYRAWRGMKKRCYETNNASFSAYGGRGIRVCDRWLNSFENFLSDMGKSPSPKHSIDRIDNDGHYEPNNCRWAPPTVQAQNKRRNVQITHLGETLVIAEWARRIGVPRHRLRQQLKRHTMSEIIQHNGRFA